MMRIDVIIEGLSSEERDRFDYDVFREALDAVEIEVDTIRFIE